MLEIFNSEFATLVVNVVVVIGLFLFLFFGIKKFLPSLAGEKLKTQIQTSTTSQNVFAFVSVVVASTFLDLFSNGKFDMLWSVAVISMLTIAFSFLYEKVASKNNTIEDREEYIRGLNLVEQIISCKGFSLIKNVEEIGKIEDQSDQIFIFTENLTTDIPKQYINNEQTFDNIGLFADIVYNNIPLGKKYTYFLKDTIENKGYLKSYCQYHFEGDREKYKSNVAFYLIDQSEFCFFSELYLYKDNGVSDTAFEWIPSIGEPNNAEKQFYLKLSSTQTQNINEIICELMVSNDKYKFEGIGYAS